jgi:hypothetical protein
VVRDPNFIKPYESAARFDVSELQRDKLVKSIRDAFRVDQLQLKESPAMTATEVQARMELMQRLLGPTFGRLQTDFLGPMIQRTFNILTREGVFDDPPQIVVDNEAELDIEYFGPLSRAQRSEDVIAVQQWISELSSVSELYPDVLDKLNSDEFAALTADMHKVPTAMINDDAAVKKIRKDRQTAEEAQGQAELDVQGSETAKNLSTAQKNLAVA